MRTRKASWEVVATLTCRSEGLDEAQVDALLVGAPLLQHRLVEAFGTSTEAAADALRGWLAWRGLIDRTAPRTPVHVNQHIQQRVKWARWACWGV